MCGPECLLKTVKDAAEEGSVRYVKKSLDCTYYQIESYNMRMVMGFDLFRRLLVGSINGWRAKRLLSDFFCD